MLECLLEKRRLHLYLRLSLPERGLLTWQRKQRTNSTGETDWFACLDFIFSPQTSFPLQRQKRRAILAVFHTWYKRLFTKYLKSYGLGG
jgi:hypothetical protein